MYVFVNTYIRNVHIRKLHLYIRKCICCSINMAKKDLLWLILLIIATNYVQKIRESTFISAMFDIHTYLHIKSLLRKKAKLLY